MAELLLLMVLLLLLLLLLNDGLLHGRHIGTWVRRGMIRGRPPLRRESIHIVTKDLGRLR